MVPALPQKISTSPAGASPGVSRTSSSPSSTWKPQRPRAARKRRVSSANSGRSITTGEPESSARLK